MKLFKRNKKPSFFEETQAVLDEADQMNKCFETFIEGCTLIHPPTEAEKEEARIFHEKVREAWGFGSDY